VGPVAWSRSKEELRHRSFRNAAVLAEAGVSVSIITDFPVLPFVMLAGSAAMAVRGGMKEEEALRAITLNPARLLGIERFAGSIEPGKRADLVLFAGHPFDLSKGVLATWLAGRRVYAGGDGAAPG